VCDTPAGVTEQQPVIVESTEGQRVVRRVATKQTDPTPAPAEGVADSSVRAAVAASEAEHPPAAVETPEPEDDEASDASATNGTLATRGAAGAIGGFLFGLALVTLAVVFLVQYGGPAALKWHCALGLVLVVGTGLMAPLGGVSGWYIALGRRSSSVSRQAHDTAALTAACYAAMFATVCLSYACYLLLTVSAAG
jgi:hypothetical protein